MALRVREHRALSSPKKQIWIWWECERQRRSSGIPRLLYYQTDPFAGHEVPLDLITCIDLIDC